MGSRFRNMTQGVNGTLGQVRDMAGPAGQRFGRLRQAMENPLKALGGGQELDTSQLDALRETLRRNARQAVQAVSESELGQAISGRDRK